jgi:hypothetical protein
VGILRGGRFLLLRGDISILGRELRGVRAGIGTPAKLEDGEGGEYKGLTGKGGSSALSIFPKDKANGDKLEEAGYVKGDKGGKLLIGIFCGLRLESGGKVVDNGGNPEGETEPLRLDAEDGERIVLRYFGSAKSSEN